MPKSPVPDPSTPRPRIPDGFVLELKSSVRFCDHDRTLIGGTPARVMHLTDSAQAFFQNRRFHVRGPASAALARRLLDSGLADPALPYLDQVEPATITVVVPAYNRADSLDRLLAGLDGVFAVVVVDDGSDNPADIGEVVDRHGARRVRLDTNVGPASARNAGLQVVDTPLVALVDSDMLVEPSALTALARHFADPKVALVAPRVLGLAGDDGNAITRYENSRSALDLGGSPALVRPGTRVSWLPAACLLARTDALGSGFGDAMRVAEDVDLVWRLDAEGWHVRYEPGVLARHEHRATLLPWLGRKAFYGTGAHDLAQRHPGLASPLQVTPWTAALIAGVLLQRRWSLAVSAAAVVATVGRVRRPLQRSQTPTRHALRLTGGAVMNSGFLLIALLLRHWWPLTLVGAVVSRRIRRAALVAAVADTAVEWTRVRPGMDPVRFGVLRRLDDAAYGAGLWYGAVRGRSWAALKPVLAGRRRTS